MTGLIGWWPLHENSGSKAYDLSGNENHGTLNGGIITGVAGKAGLTSYSLDGNDDYIDTSLNFDKRSFTYSGWVRPRNPNKDFWADLIDCYDVNDSSDWARLAYREGEAVFFTDSEGSGGGITDLRGGNITAGWHHLVGVRDIEAGQLKLYVDSKLVASKSTKSDGVIDGTYNEVIGRRTDANNGEQVKGKLNDIRIYDRALTSAEIQTLYKWGNGDYAKPLNNQNSSSAVSRWAFDGDATDSWGNNDGTVNGATYDFDGGIRGGAYSFDGDNDWISTSPVFGGLTDYSVSAWFNSDSVSRQTLFSERHTNVDDIRLNLQLMEDNTVRSIIRKGSGSLYEARGGTYSANNFYHISAIRNGETQKIYLNGIKVGESSAPSGTISQDQDSYIGKQTTSSTSNVDLPFDGTIDDLRIYSKAFSPSEVFELYRWGTKGIDMRKKLVNKKGGA